MEWNETIFASFGVVLKKFEDKVMTLANTLEEQNSTIQTSVQFTTIFSLPPSILMKLLIKLTSTTNDTRIVSYTRV